MSEKRIEEIADNYVKQWTEPNDKLAQRRCRVDFLAGASEAIKLLSGIDDLPKYHVTKDKVNMTTQEVYREKDVAPALAKLEAENAALRAELALYKERP
jgi:hypothetical protein